MAPVKVDRAPTPEEEQRRTLLRTQAKQVAGS
jgi:hypothetical protein